MGENVDDKVLLILDGKPLLQWSIEAFAESGVIGDCVIVCRDDLQQQTLQKIIETLPLPFAITFATGGQTRSQSVINGLKALPDTSQYVFIHDGARPFIRSSQIKALSLAAHRSGAVVLAHRVVETIKELSVESPCPGETTPLKTLERSRLWAMETPQVFDRKTITNAYNLLGANDFTDDSSGLEQLRVDIEIMENPLPNPKLTHPGDITYMKEMARQLNPHSSSKPAMLIGHGYDIHRFAPHRKLVLGGVEIASDEGLLGHSDADVLSHALADAIFGACGLPDIGVWFPNTDASIEGISSLKILSKAIEEAGSRGYKINNVDLSIIAEKPKISPHLQAIKASLAEVLQISPDQVGIKATTNEKVGDIGKGLAMAANAVVLLQKLS
jgi:2-C-methyl-D-erythritol 2,4-cyclodiphosphate synthase/2-C-methyl-D-erythritol 4-phosphate cytidylyltransferase